MRPPIMLRSALLALLVAFAATYEPAAAADDPAPTLIAPNANPSPLPTDFENTSPDQLFDESLDEPQEQSSSEGSGESESLEEQLEDPVSERNFQSDVLVLSADHLLGDWCGYRTDLEDDGITPSVTFVSDMLGNPVGGVRQGFAEADNLGINFGVDMEKRYGIRGGRFQLSMSQRSGRSLSNEYIGNTFSTQQVWGGPTFKVINVAYEQTFGDDDVEFLIGRIAAGDDFLVSQYNYLFVQNGFCGNPVGIFFNAPGMSAYPNATWGSVL